MLKRTPPSRKKRRPASADSIAQKRQRRKKQAAHIAATSSVRQTAAQLREDIAASPEKPLDQSLSLPALPLLASPEKPQSLFLSLMASPPPTKPLSQSLSLPPLERDGGANPADADLTLAMDASGFSPDLGGKQHGGTLALGMSGLSSGSSSRQQGSSNEEEEKGAKPPPSLFIPSEGMDFSMEDTFEAFTPSPFTKTPAQFGLLRPTFSPMLSGQCCCCRCCRFRLLLSLVGVAPVLS